MSTEITRPPSVRIAFRTLGRALKHGYENLITLGIASVLWWLCTRPFFLVVAFIGFSLGGGSTILNGSTIVLAIGLLFVGWGPPSAALHRITRPMTEERSVPGNSFWRHLRADFGWSLRLALTLLFALFLWLINTNFYTGSTSTALQLISGFFLIATLMWLGVMLYAFPMALRQVEQSLRSTLRNAVVVALANLPGLLVSLLLLLITTAILIVLPPLFLMIPGWIALWAEENVRLLLVASGLIAPDEIADRQRGS